MSWGQVGDASTHSAGKWMTVHQRCRYQEVAPSSHPRKSQIHYRSYEGIQDVSFSTSVDPLAETHFPGSFQWQP